MNQLTICVKIADAVGSTSYAFLQVRVDPANLNFFNLSINTQLPETLKYWSLTNDVYKYVAAILPILDEFIHFGPGEIDFLRLLL